MAPFEALDSAQIHFVTDVFDKSRMPIEPPFSVFRIMCSDGNEHVVAVTQNGVFGSPAAIRDIQTLLTNLKKFKEDASVLFQEDRPLFPAIPSDSKLLEIFPDLETGAMESLRRGKITTWADLENAILKDPHSGELRLPKMKGIGEKRAETIIALYTAFTQSHEKDHSNP